jgi:dipeptidyl aminopeptidase/acylaminoacyl peptidase
MTVNPIRLYDLLGIDPSLHPDDQDAKAATLWPNDRINATEGYNVSDDRLLIVHWLQGILTFDQLRPGADRDVVLGGAAGQISLSANLHVAGASPPATTLYLRDLPNVGIQLVPTGSDKPPTVFFASDGRGYEVLVENLPVDLVLPP